MVRRIEYNFMYKHGTCNLYLRVKNKKQLEREGEREKKYEAVNHFYSKTPLIISKRPIYKPLAFQQ